jgi:para-aminobenzoate synthetase component 1
MISTVVAEIEEKDTVSCIKNAFPMGSMTGAPKVKSMELIEKYERSRRGLYSGSVGYFSPAGDFDLNVVIRSMFYNEKNMYLSYSVGGAITYLSDPQKEYEECLLKAKAMKQVLED